MRCALLRCALQCVAVSSVDVREIATQRISMVAFTRALVKHKEKAFYKRSNVQPRNAWRHGSWRQQRAAAYSKLNPKHQN